MKLNELIADRRTIHDYREGDLPEGALRRAVEAATSAPNHRMTEPWRFINPGPEAREALVEIAVDLKSQGGSTPLNDNALARLRAKMLNPSELLVVCQVRHDDPGIAKEDYAAVACSVQNAMLCLWSEGIGSKWSTGGVTTDERTYARLRVDAAREAIVGFLWIGYPQRSDLPKPRRRRALEEVLRRVE